MVRRAFVAVAVLGALAGCDLIGPSCLGRQQTGTVANIRGEVGPGTVVSHLVSYGTEGSQNTGELQWTGDRVAGGPRIQVYATLPECVDFDPANYPGTGACRVLARAGELDSGNIANTLIITHGRGNPETLGSPPMYKLWVVGDPRQSASYTIDITWFYGPDC